MKFPISSVVLIALVIAGCGSGGGGSSVSVPDQSAGGGLGPTPQPPAPAPQRNSYVGAETILKLGGKTIVIVSVAELATAGQDMSFHEITEVADGAVKQYTRREGKVEASNGASTVSVHFNPLDVQFHSFMNAERGKQFNDIRAKVSDMTKRELTVDVETIRRNLQTQHRLWTYRCRSAGDWNNVAARNPDRHGSQLLSLPRVLAIDRYIGARTSAIEIKLENALIVGFPTQITGRGADEDPYGEHVLYGDKLAATNNNLFGDLSLYNPHQVIEFFGYCRGVYLAHFGRSRPSPYDKYFPTVHPETEALIAGLSKRQLMAKGYGVYGNTVDRQFKPAIPFDESTFPIEDNLSSEDLAFLKSKNFVIPKREDFQ